MPQRGVPHADVVNHLHCMWQPQARPMYHHRAGCTTNLVHCLQCAHAASSTTHTAVSQSSDSGHLHCRPLSAPLYTTASNCSCLALTTVPKLRTWCCLRYMNVATACMYTVMFSDAITSQLSHHADQHMPRTTLADPMHHMATHYPGGPHESFRHSP
jgi:hypothetical protein